MADLLTSNTFAQTYKDDFDPAKGYHRLLFNPGRPLQARELTQMQTIIQAEIARFGKNIFKEGAAVNPGGPQIDTKYEYIKLETGVYDLPVNTSTLIGTTFVSSDANLAFRVLEVFDATDTDPATIYGQYTTTGEIVSSVSIRMVAGDIITNGTTTLQVQTTNTVSNPAVGVGTKFSSEAGDFFAQGHFVFAPQQSIMLSKYESTWSGTVGFYVIQDIVTVNDTETLYDNSGAVYDHAAPGADRLRIRLILTTKDAIDSDQNFVYFAEVRDGLIVDQASGSNDYNELENRLATRTYEESGDYVVKPFKMTFEDHLTDDTKLNINLSSGLAYVNGYRVYVPSDIKIETPKAQTYETKNNEVVAADYGNYVFTTNLVGLPDIANFGTVNLRSDITHGGSTIGTARVRYITEDGSYYRMYLFDIQMSGSNSFRNVKSIGTSTTVYANLLLESDKAVLKETNNNNLLFNLPTERPKSLADIILEVQRQFDTTTSGTGTATISLTATGETFANTGDWIIVRDDTGAVITPTITGSGTASVSISGAPNSVAITILAKVTKAAGKVRTKTLTNATPITASITTSGDTKYVDLGQVDIFKVSAIRDTDVNGDDISSRFTVDNGQRDNFYDNGRLILKNGVTEPTTVYVEFTYFAHGASGDFFAANSYTGQVDYSLIPDHRLSDGTTINLRNVLDFRPAKVSGNFVAQTSINELPEQATTIYSDITYYLPRQDRLVINTKGEVLLLQGEPGFTPQLPEIPVNSMLLFNVGLNPYTLSRTDVTVKKFDYKRYTMADIADLDKKIEEVRELATLSLLEIDTANLTILDSDGLQRTKAGFLVDNFKDQTFSDIYQFDYSASIDPQNGLLRPSFEEDNIRMIFDETKSSGVVLKGDNIYLDYTDTTYIAQPLVSGTENVNPFAVITGEGALTMSPASDEWKWTQTGGCNFEGTCFDAEKVVPGGTLINGKQSTLWSNWLWNWSGVSIDNVRVGSTTSTSSSAWLNRWYDRVSTTTARVASVETIREVIGSRVVDQALVPYMRARKVFFRAEGLRPNSRFFPFFDGINVTDWVIVESFTRYASHSLVYARNAGLNLLSHPEYNPLAADGEAGSKVLISDADGRLEGSFFIPATSNIKFTSGTKQFKLLDVSVNNDAQALSKSMVDFESKGLLETVQKTVKSTRSVSVELTKSTRDVRVRYGDPIAQTFYISEPEGIFLTKLDLFFASKDDSLPVQVQIRTVNDGTPTRTMVPGGMKYISAADVNIPTSQTQAGVSAAPTTVEFDEPIFLAGGEEYAVVLLAETTNYNVYVAETYAFQLGSTEMRISKQPYLGSFFKSQNGSTWTPSQTQDLAFKMYRADFNTNGTLIVENGDVVADELTANPFMFTDSDATVFVYHPDHGFDVNDTVTFAGVDATYAGITAANINGDRTITAVDGNGYTFEAGSSATSSTVGGGLYVTATRNRVFDTFVPFFETLVPQNTNLSFDGKFTSGKSLAGDEVRFQKDLAYSTLVNKENHYANAPQMIANPADETAELGSGERSATISIGMSTTSSYVSPVIDMQRASLYTISNKIDKQAETPTTGYNVPLSFVDETSPAGGSSLAKHITTPVTLAADAIGLKMIIAANRPSVANFDVYYRTAGGETILSDQAWTLLSSETSIPADDNPAVFREYRYLTGALTAFTQFQVKIVFNSSNSSRVPVLRDFRAIALVD